MMMIVGFACTAITVGKLLDPYTPQRLLEISGALSLLVVLVAVVVWLFRRGAQGSTVGGQIQLLAAFPVGPRERLLVVRMQDRILALGHTPTHISLLAELDDFEPMANSGSLPSGFAGQLMTLLSRKNSA